MAKPRIDPAEGKRCVQQWQEQRTDAPREVIASAVRYTLQVLRDANPGPTVEVRVPPFGAVQCVEGPEHTRGTPPNVVETDPQTWLQLATGDVGWVPMREAGKVIASGTRSDLSLLLPLAEW
jgi:hypothetical protein